MLLKKSRWILVPLLLVVMAGGFLVLRQSTKTHAAAVTGAQIVTIAQNIQNGKMGTGRIPDVCVSTVAPVKCVQYSWGAGHGATPGLSLGKCDKSYHGPQPCLANKTVGLDCSGFTRWVYALAYGKDVLGSSTTASQISHLTDVTKITSGPNTPQPGDLVFFAHQDGKIFHEGVVVGPDQMINSPKTNFYVRQQSISGFTLNTTDHRYGYYRYVTPASIPTLVSQYTGTVHNETYNVTANYALSGITEDQQGNISGQSIVSLPLYGSGPFKGTVNASNAIAFTATSTDLGGLTINFTGTVNQDGSLSGNYITSSGQVGTWQVSAG